MCHSDCHLRQEMNFMLHALRTPRSYLLTIPACAAVVLLAACGGGSGDYGDTQLYPDSAIETEDGRALGHNKKTTTEPAPEPSTVWTYCAPENGTCTVSGTREVRYGASGTYAIRTATSSIACNNTTFGDPLPGVVKACEYSDTTTSEPAPAPAPSTSETRDPLKWPFSSNSIWNMPIGSSAQYVAANLNPTPGGDVWAPVPQVDDEIIILKPTAPLTNVNYSDAAWTGKNRCSATGGLLFQAPIPTNYLVPHNNANGSAVILAADGRTLIHTQPFTRCTSGAAATALVRFPAVDLYGTGHGGSHGGSGLSAIGGSIRLGELRPGQQGPRHALKVNVYAREALARCSSYASCYRWPATAADSYAVGHYGSNAPSNVPTGMKMGALLAIPASVNIGSLGLETEPARQLAWTLQNYGSYIVDDTWGPAFALNAETGPDGNKRSEFRADWGFDLEQRVNGNTPWTRDMQRLMRALHLVDNNGPSSIGGGGTPRQPLAPAFK
jgi:hypothetical protein